MRFGISNICRSVVLFVGQLLYQLIPYFYAIHFEIVQSKKIRNHEKHWELGKNKKFLALSEEELSEAHQLEIDRQEQLRKNGQLHLGASTIAISLTFGLSKLESVDGWLSIAAVVVAVMSLVATAICAIRATSTRPTHKLWLQNRVMKTADLSDTDYKKNRKLIFIQLTLQNQASNLIIANYSAAGAIGMRNAVLAVGVFLIFTLVSTAWS